MSFLGLETAPEEAAVVLVPVGFEATVSYGRGTAAGPEAIRAASPQLDLFDLETGQPHEAGIALLEPDPRVAAWNEEAVDLAARVIEACDDGREDDPALEGPRRRVNAIMAALNAWLGGVVRGWQERGKLVGVVGGDHSVPFAAIEAAAARWPGVGLLHIDAHADLRLAYQGFTWSHASILRNVRDRVSGVAKVVGVGYRDLCAEEHEVLVGDARFAAFYDPWLRRRLEEGTPWAEVAAEVVRALPEQVYVTLDVDGLDPALCPHTGTPVPGGLSFTEATSLLRAIAESGRRIVGFDLVEVAPDPTGRSEWDANVGARLLYKLAGFALMTRPGLT